MNKTFTRNEHGVKIQMCCASCKKRKVTSEDGRVCGLTGKPVKGCHYCKQWEMTPQLHNAGMSGGRIKSRHYLNYYRERWIEQREAVETGQLSAMEMLSVADIRHEFEKAYGSIFINF